MKKSRTKTATKSKNLSMQGEKNAKAEIIAKPSTSTKSKVDFGDNRIDISKVEQT